MVALIIKVNHMIFMLFSFYSKLIVNGYVCLCFGVDVRLRAHPDSQQPGKGGITQTSEHREKQLPYNQKNPETVDGGYQWTGLCIFVHLHMSFWLYVTHGFGIHLSLEPQRYLVRVQRLRSPERSSHSTAGTTRLEEHRGGAQDVTWSSLWGKTAASRRPS